MRRPRRTLAEVRAWAERASPGRKLIAQFHLREAVIEQLRAEIRDRKQEKKHERA